MKNNGLIYFYGALFIVAVVATFYLARSRYEAPQDVAPPPRERLTEADKMRLLDTLATKTIVVNQKQKDQILNSVSSSSTSKKAATMPEDEKIKVLDSINTNN